MRLQNSNTSHVTINPNLKLIKITPEYSNTSHVTINQDNMMELKETVEIQIHLMLLLITLFRFHSMRSWDIQIHLMLLLIRKSGLYICISLWNSNTSHVTINPTTRNI